MVEIFRPVNWQEKVVPKKKADPKARLSIHHLPVA